MQQADIDEDKLRRILTNVMVATRLYSASDAEYLKIREDTGKGDVNKQSYTVSIDHSYVCLTRKTSGLINDNLQQLGGCSDMTSDEIGAILARLHDRVTPETHFCYKLNNDRLVRTESPVVGHFLVAFAERCPFAEKKVRYAFHIALLKHYLPSKLDNVDFFFNQEVVAPIEHVDNSLCIVCIKNQRTMLIKPCHHLMVCIECANTLKDYRCPVCQSAIKSLTRVYM